MTKLRRLTEAAQMNEVEHSNEFYKTIQPLLNKVYVSIAKLDHFDYRKAQQTLGYAAGCLAALQHYVNHVGQNTDEWLADYPTEANKYYKQAMDSANRL